MPPHSHYLKKRAALAEHPDFRLDNRWLFVGIDLAPNEQLESGMVILDRERTLLRMDKLYSDDAILQVLDNLGSLNQCIVALDMPKNLKLSGKFLQEEIKLHPLRLSVGHLDRNPQDRYAARGRKLYDWLNDRGALVMLYFSYGARLTFDLLVPFRSRSPHGCRALQNAIRQLLDIRNMPTNLAPSSVLDAMVGAYCAWLVYIGEEDHHYRLFEDEEKRLLIRPISRFDWESLTLRPEWIPY